MPSVSLKEGVIVGCGDWSFRNTLHAGSKEDFNKISKLNAETDRASIRAMFVDLLYNGRGIGSLILEHSEKAAKAYRFSKAAFGATLSGFAFYKAKGWTPVAEEMATLPNGVTIGVVQMVKDF